MPPQQTLSSIATDPIRNFRFVVSFAPRNNGSAWTRKGVAKPGRMAFTSVSGLAMTTESIPYREGSQNTTVHQIPGQTTFSPITLARGVKIGARENWHWMTQLFNVIAGSGNGQEGNDFRMNLDILVLDHPSTQYTSDFPQGKLQFRVHNAWITSLAYSDLNAGDNALMVEQMTLVHEGLQTSWATSTTTGIPPF